MLVGLARHEQESSADHGVVFSKYQQPKQSINQLLTGEPFNLVGNKEFIFINFEIVCSSPNSQVSLTM